MPASSAVRTGLVTATALTLALLAGSPALAVEAPELQVGGTCVPEQAPLLPPEWTCEEGSLVFTPVVEPPPVEEPSTPPSTEEPPPNPLPELPPVVVDPPPVIEVPPVVSGPIPGPVPAEPGPAPAPNTPTDPRVPGGSLSDNAKNEDASPTTPATAVAPGRSLLAAATVSTLASSDLPTLAAMRAAPLPTGTAGSPLSAYMPAPLMANLPPNAALAAVQAPLLAAGDDAAGGGGFALAGLDSKALPGLLVVLATALVAAVGAGNLRAWQERMPQWRRAYARARR